MFHAKLAPSIMFNVSDLEYADSTFLVDWTIDCIDQLGLNDCILYNAREYGALECLNLKVGDVEDFKSKYDTISVDQFKNQLTNFVNELQRQAQLEDEFQ